MEDRRSEDHRASGGGRSVDGDGSAADRDGRVDRDERVDPDDRDDGVGALGGEEDGAAFRAVFRESFDAMVIADDDGRYVEVNPAACELFGLDREALLGRSIADFAPEGFDFEAAWERFAEGKNERGLFPLVRPDGERRTVEYSATREVLPGRHLSILRDVTEREENERRLRRRRDALDTLNRINELVRETVDDVVEARTRGTIERTACEKIADSDLYAFALVGERDRRNGGIAVRAGVGVDDDWIARVEDLAAAEAELGPGVEAIRSDEIQLLDADDLGALPDHVSGILADSGAESLLVAPISFGTVGYGFLAIGANRDGAFGEREVEGFSALANAIGFAINAVESKQSLSADATTALEVDVDDPASPLARVVDPDGPVAVEALLPLDDTSALVYARIGADRAEEVRRRAEDADEVERVAVVERSGAGWLLEVVLRRRTPIHALHDLGAGVADVTVSPGGTWRLAVELPPERDVREVVDSLRERYPSVTLRSRGVEAGATGAGREPFDRLTDRQRTVIEAAYQSGYYDWPTRGRSAEELAETLGIAPQTLLEHLRKAERVAVEALVDGR